MDMDGDEDCGVFAIGCWFRWLELSGFLFLGLGFSIAEQHIETMKVFIFYIHFISFIISVVPVIHLTSYLHRKIS